MGTAYLTGENVKFSRISRLRPSSKFSIGETTKPTEDDTKIQQGELKNIMRQHKNIFT